MGNSLASILSTIFIVMFCLFGVDLLTVQSIYSSLDAMSINVGYIISYQGTVDSVELREYLGSNEITFKCLTNPKPKFGDFVEYTISKQYKPLFISPNALDLTVKRSAVIGFYE